MNSFRNLHIIIAVFLFTLYININAQTSIQPIVEHEYLYKQGSIIHDLNPHGYLKNPLSLLNNWSSKPILVSNYTLKDIKAQEYLNEQENYILSFDPVPDSLEVFPDNSNLSIELRNIDYEDITPTTWKWIFFELQKPDSSISVIKLRRPNWWILANNADSIGNKVSLSIPEAGIKGQATVTDLKPNQLDTRFYSPEWLDQKTYRPITGWFQHSSETWNFYFEGEPEAIGATAVHPFWSVDRQAYIPVGELKIGEKVKTRKGTVCKLQKKEKRQGKEPVYNLEIYRDHNFHVGEQGLLVHNSYFNDLIKDAKIINKMSASDIEKVNEFYKLGVNPKSMLARGDVRSTFKIGKDGSFKPRCTNCDNGFLLEKHVGKYGGDTDPWVSFTLANINDNAAAAYHATKVNGEGFIYLIYNPGMKGNEAIYDITNKGWSLEQEVGMKNGFTHDKYSTFIYGAIYVKKNGINQYEYLKFIPNDDF